MNWWKFAEVFFAKCCLEAWPFKMVNAICLHVLKIFGNKCMWLCLGCNYNYSAEKNLNLNFLITMTCNEKKPMVSIDLHHPPRNHPLDTRQLSKSWKHLHFFYCAFNSNLLGEDNLYTMVSWFYCFCDGFYAVDLLT